MHGETPSVIRRRPRVRRGAQQHVHRLRAIIQTLREVERREPVDVPARDALRREGRERRDDRRVGAAPRGVVYRVRAVVVGAIRRGGERAKHRRGRLRGNLAATRVVQRVISRAITRRRRGRIGGEHEGDDSPIGRSAPAAACSGVAPFAFAMDAADGSAARRRSTTVRSEPARGDVKWCVSASRVRARSPGYPRAMASTTSGGHPNATA